MSMGRWAPLCFAALLFAARGQAEDKVEAKAEQDVDAEFLEYLGSVESQEDNWTDFESSEDASKAKTATEQDSKSNQQSKQIQQAQKSTQASTPTSKSTSKAKAQ